MMKFYCKMAVICAMLILLGACSSRSNSPEAVTHKFLNALEHQDFGVARSLITQESETVFELIESFTSSMDERQARAYQHQILESTVIGDTARVSYEIWTLGLEESKEQMEVKLLKVKGKWKLSLEKEDFNK